MNELKASVIENICMWLLKTHCLIVGGLLVKLGKQRKISTEVVLDIKWNIIREPRGL